jgi:glycosyltransferase involved in cell wall biosynthesis
MKVLYVITKANWGGAQRYVFDLALAAKESGHEPAIAYGEAGLLVEYATQAGIPTFPIQGLTNGVFIGDEWAAFRALLRLIKEWGPEVVHANSSKAGLALLAARLLKVKRTLFTVHGWAFNEERAWWQKVAFRMVYAVTILLAHKTICVSEAVRLDMEAFLKKAPVIYNGIAAPAFKPRKDSRCFVPEVKDKIWLGMLSELHPNKGVDDAIRALADLKDEYPDVVLVVFGDGRERQRLQELVRRCDLVGCVFLVGFVEDGASYLSAFDIFLMPSRTEALAYSLIEAGYAGLPVIAARRGGIPEIVTHQKTGLLVPAKNPHVLARAIRRLLDNPEEAKSYGAALKESVTAQFLKERMVTETFAQY